MDDFSTGSVVEYFGKVESVDLLLGITADSVVLLVAVAKPVVEEIRIDGKLYIIMKFAKVRLIIKPKAYLQAIVVIMSKS